jgi:Flp pilus assembly protein TadB
MHEYAFLLGAAVPCVVVSIYILEGIWKGWERVSKRVGAFQRRKRMLASLPEVISRAYEARGNRNQLYSYLDSQMKRIEWNIQPAAFLVLSVTTAFAGLATGLFLLRNIASAVAIMVIAVFVPFLVLSWKVQKHEQRVLEQLPMAIQLFTVEFEMTKSIAQALARVSEIAANPLKRYLSQCAKDLTAGKQSARVFNKFSSDLNCEYGRLWAQILLAAHEDSTVMKIMPRLISRLHQQRLLIQKNLTELSGARRLGVLLNILVVPGFIITQVLFPDTLEFYSQPLGRAVILVLFLSVTAGIVLDQTLKKIDL